MCSLFIRPSRSIATVKQTTVKWLSSGMFIRVREGKSLRLNIPG